MLKERYDKFVSDTSSKKKTNIFTDGIIHDGDTLLKNKMSIFSKSKITNLFL